MPANVTKAIVLAGGLGTRLRTAVPDLPKCMAPVNGIPFITYVVKYLHSMGIGHFVFALGYRSEQMISYIEALLPADCFRFSVEDKPLGTGGAVRLACAGEDEQHILVVNGDTLFRADVQELAAFHMQQNALCTMALKPMKSFSRYGAVELDDRNAVMQFREKQYCPEGLINGGVYVLNVPAFMAKELPEQFSFEQDFLEKYSPGGEIYGVKQDAYFIDIGIPEDYTRAGVELRRTDFNAI